MKAIYNPYLFWIPRILTILLILFVMIFSLDVFDGKHTFWEYVAGFLMHNIPAGILLITLIISWRYEIVGAIVYISSGLFYAVMMMMSSSFTLRNSMVAITLLGLPAIIIGVLFLLGWIQRRKIAKTD